MGKTTMLRKQHEEILEKKDTILKMLHGENLATNSKEIRSLLAQFAGALTVHLAMEDNGLYPKLLANENPDIQRITATYIKDIQGLKDGFSLYIKKWPSNIVIERHPEEFIKDTKDIFLRLDNRIRKEDNELYYIVDRL